jgi:hypothetical protein
MMKLGQRDMKRPTLYYCRYEMMMTYDEKSKCGYSAQAQFGSVEKALKADEQLTSRNNVGNRAKRTTNPEGLGKPLRL